ncbi:CHRD domain-containing protein [Tengunoibacter tsumagoiensis]|uniref:Uncharacterized protein n=1 Tax=Tengunoibacter tsumagoiensis TaxID=2014871 RepID=A0A402A3P4_9CHLR|nr:CHRD domain-containing protein [Tengunoibacter tsumagoiensis]GCE13669.1 hypothetical protein KTT_35280 [Tengunoibacter tsumagoiensis]
MSHTIKTLLWTGFLSLLLLTSTALTNASVQARSALPTLTGALALLRHAPAGVANLRWNPTTKGLIVTIKVEGLQANTHHPAHIHSGLCPTDGPIVYKLNDVVADAAGNGTSQTMITNVTNGIPATAWHINVHSGPTLNTPAEALPVACGNVKNTQTLTTQPQAVTTALGSVATAANQNVMGATYLTLTGTTLTVRTMVANLVPGTAHAFHIHAGSCESQLPGTILYKLNNLVAGPDGTATSTTTIQNVTTIPATGWYINLHFSTNLATQPGYDVIACGNVISH